MTDDPGPRTQTINGVDFVLTCAACPEQYDAFIEGIQVAYVRLRGGRLTAEVPDVGGALVYATDRWRLDGEPLLGMFLTDTERTEHLAAIGNAVSKFLLRQAFQSITALLDPPAPR